MFRASLRCCSSSKRLSFLLLQNLNRCTKLKLFTERLVFTSSALGTEKTELESNPFYDKYAEKLKMANKNMVEKEEKNNQSMESKVQYDPRTLKKAEKLKTKVRNHQEEKAMKHVSSQYQSGGISQYGQQTLGTVIHMDCIEELTGEEIAKLWKEYHKKKDCISACIPSDVYQIIQEKAAKYPLFIYPLPRENGYEFMFAEFSGNFCYLTPLLQYQTLGENAPWVLAINHFTELRESKGIVLMVGELDSKQLSVMDGQWLGYQIQMYYASNSPEKDILLRIFNKEPDKFDHMSVIKLLDSEIASGASDIIKETL